MGVREVGAGLLIALADGAGGTSNGAEAAQAVVDMAMSLQDGSPWSDPRAALAAVDVLDRDVVRRKGGQSTAVLLSITSAGMVGVSVGDSGAWVIRGEDIQDLTEGQLHKPLLGAGCVPWEIKGGPLAGGTLLVASDGLLKYAKPSEIARVVGGDDLAASARSLVDLVRLRSGALQDDVSIVLCRGRR